MFKRKIARIISLIFILSGGTIPVFAFADNECLNVFYPQAKAPYDGVFRSIIKGIKDTAGWPVYDFKIDANSTIVFDQESDHIEVESCAAQVALGRIGIEYIKQTPHARTPSVFGAIRIEPGVDVDIPTISFMPDPAELFIRLKHFSKAIKTIHIAYDPSTSKTFIQHAGDIAKDQGYEFITYPILTIKEAIPTYRKILKLVDPKNDAIWLLQNGSSADAKVVLPMVLKTAWSRRLTVFSNHPIHAKKGALFSVFPDNYQLGKELGALAVTCAKNNCDSPKVLALRHLKTAFNTRTAGRLKVKINRRKDPYADLFFPNR